MGELGGGWTGRDALVTCMSTGTVFRTRLPEDLHVGESVAGEVPRASEFQDAHSRNSSEPTTLGFSTPVLTAPREMLISFFSAAAEAEISRGGYSEGPPRKSQVT